MRTGRNASSNHGGSVTSSDDSASGASEKSLPYDAYPEAVSLQVQGALDLGSTLPSDYMTKYNGRSYSVGDVLAATDTGIAPKPRVGRLYPSGRSSDLRSSPVHRKDEATAAQKTTAPRGGFKRGNGDFINPDDDVSGPSITDISLFTLYCREWTIAETVYRAGIV